MIAISLFVMRLMMRMLTKMRDMVLGDGGLGADKGREYDGIMMEIVERMVMKTMMRMVMKTTVKTMMREC